MSSIDKLGIQGIRSFGPDILCKIDFFSPLTLILGQNGCGKTTIIESLKFVTTGERPPGCGAGAAFIHDPKIAKDTSVRAQVKLRFKSIKNQVVTGCRSVEATQKAKKLEYQSLESTLEYCGAQGKRRISSNCIDYHLEMTSLLGVVKPILENVIFCHQEDSNWPLDEGKKVKDKFDAIFNATKYIKCLDSIRKVHKDKKLYVKSLKDKLEGLQGMKDQAKRFHNELQATNDTKQELMGEKQRLEDEKNPVLSSWRKVDMMLKSTHSLSVELGKNEQELKGIRKLQDQLKMSQDETYTCPDAELRNMRKNFECNVRNQEENVRELSLTLDGLCQDISKIKKSESDALFRMGKLEAAEKSHFDNMKKRDILLKKLVSKYNIHGYTACKNFETNESQDILNFMGTLLQEEQKEAKKKKRNFEQQEAEFQKQLVNLRAKEMSLHQHITSLSDSIETNSKNLSQVHKKMRMNEDDLSSMNLEELKQSLEEIITKIKVEEERVDVLKLESEREKRKEEREKIERQLDDMKRKINKMNKQVEAQSQYDIHLKEKNLLEKRNQQLKCRNDSEFSSIFNGQAGDNIKNELEAQLNHIRKLKSQEGENKSIHERKKTELRMKIESEKAQIEKTENEIKAFESKLEDLCGRKDLEDAIEKTKDEINHLRKVIGDHESSFILFQSFMEKLRAGEACPLCHRDFDDGYEELLIEEIERKLRYLPDELTKRQKELKLKDEFHSKLVQLKPQKEVADQLMKEVIKQRARLEEFYQKMDKISSDLDNCSDQFGILLSEEEICNRVLPDVLTIDSNLKAIRQLSEKITNIQATLGTSDNDMSMDEMMKVQSNLEQKVKNLQKEIESNNTEIMEHKCQLQRLNQRKLQLSTQELELKTKQQAVERLKAEKIKLEEEISKLKEKKEDSLIEIAPIRVELNEIEEKKMKVRLEGEKITNEDNRKMEEIRDERRQALEINKTILLYLEDGTDTALEEGKQQLRHLREQIKTKEIKDKQIQGKVNLINKELNMQKEKKRSLDNEMKIRELEVEAKELEEKVAQLQLEIENSDRDKMKQESERLSKEHQRIVTRLATLEGKLEGVEDRIKDLKRNLDRKDIKQAEKFFNDMIIEMKCNEIGCDDLNKYYMALDMAVMRFHKDKMNNINTIIRELWRSTYRGNDIDYIEIKTEAESQGADKRRNYQYRVVMVKNDVEMDMRARCSAGQKVLASLIIRMALAETFSTNCGVLALDEPTTNLDRDNIEALSYALLNIVNNRSQQKNFQLIVITHDNEFLERLSRADYIDYYYEVSRNSRGLSVITKHPAR